MPCSPSSWSPTRGREGDQAFLREKLQIDALDSVLFVLKQPSWRRKGGDARFWNAEGEVREFLGRLYDEAMCPLRMERRLAGELARSSSVECLYLFLPGAKSLERVYEEYSDQYAFFTALESMHLSEVLAEVRTRVRMSALGRRWRSDLPGPQRGGAATAACTWAIEVYGTGRGTLLAGTSQTRI